MTVKNWKSWAILIAMVATLVLIGWAFSSPADAATPSCMGNAGACGVEGAPPPTIDMDKNDARCVLSGAVVGGATLAGSATGPGELVIMPAVMSAAGSTTTCYIAQW